MISLHYQQLRAHQDCPNDPSFPEPQSNADFESWLLRGAVKDIELATLWIAASKKDGETYFERRGLNTKSELCSLTRLAYLLGVRAAMQLLKETLLRSRSPFAE